MENETTLPQDENGTNETLTPPVKSEPKETNTAKTVVGGWIAYVIGNFMAVYGMYANLTSSLIQSDSGTVWVIIGAFLTIGGLVAMMMGVYAALQKLDSLAKHVLPPEAE